MGKKDRELYRKIRIEYLNDGIKNNFFDRQTERQKDRWTDRHRDIETETCTYIQIERQAGRRTERERHIDRKTNRDKQTIEVSVKESQTC